MPVIGRRNADDIDRFVVEHPANVLGVVDELLLPAFDGLDCPADDARVHVANCRDDGVELLVASEAIDVAHAAAMNADDGDAQLRIDIASLGCDLFGCFLGDGGSFQSGEA